MNFKASVRGVLAGVACAAVALTGLSAPALAANAELPASITASKTLTYCSAISQPPWEFYSAQQQPEGLDIDLGNLLARRLGLQAKYINMPFAGVVPALLAGHCDAVISALFVKPARLKVIDEIPYMVSRETVLLKAGAPKVAGLDALSGRKVATVTGTSATVVLQDASQDLAKAGKKPIAIVTFPENVPALQQLQFGQVYAYGVAYETAVYYEHLDQGQFEEGVAPFSDIQVGIGVAKTEPGLDVALSSALDGAMKDGSYAAVFKKWGLGVDALNH
jgi:polar amino acid transport system substrate-binding protein